MSNQNNFLHTAPGSFAPTMVADELRSIFGYYAAQKGLQFHCSVDADTADLRLTGEVSILKLVLYSLLSNSVKFTDRGSVTIQFSNKKCGEHELDLLVCIRDSGCGIESARLSTIFNSGNAGGFGLSMCHRLVTGNRGTISAKSAPGKGSEFNFSMPFTYSLIDPAAIITPGRKLKILVVDDDEMSLLVMSNMLAKHSILHTPAHSGKEAISKFSSGDFDIVITDLHMPEVNGEQLLNELETRKRKIPAIAVTSGNRGVLSESYISKGFSKVLVKPFREEDLLKAIKTVTSQPAPETTDSENSAFRKNRFSTDELCRISNNSEEFVRMMLEKFAVLSVANTEKMLAALVSGDSETVMQLAHKSIPSFHMLGLTATAEHLKCIERNLREDNDLAESSVLIRNVHEQTREVVAEIKKYLNSLKQNEVIQ